MCVYAAPETKILHAKQALPQAQSCFHVFEIETKNQQRRFDFELVKPKSAAELRTAANVYQTLCRLQPSDIPFDTPSDKAAFGFVSIPCGLRRREPGVFPLLSNKQRYANYVIVVVDIHRTKAEQVPPRYAIL